MPKSYRQEGTRSYRRGMSGWRAQVFQGDELTRGHPTFPARSTASRASFCPTTRFSKRSSIFTSFSRSLSSIRDTGIPVQDATMLSFEREFLGIPTVNDRLKALNERIQAR